jgi:DNA-binding NarL/FixJ family response regulator
MSGGGGAKLTILLADDHLVVRQGLRSLLEMNPAVEVVGEASDGEQLMRSVAELEPDVVLLDIRMPQVGGIEAVRRLLASGSRSRFIAITAYEEEEYMLEAIRAGVHGYLLKDVDAEALNRAVESVAHGEMVLDPRVSRTVQELMVRGPVPDALSRYGLTTREREVVELLPRDISNQEIAQRLFISANTLKFHLKNIYAKLGVSTRREAIRITRG